MADLSLKPLLYVSTLRRDAAIPFGLWQAC